MRRFGAIITLFILLSSAFAIGASADSAASTCYRGTFTITNLSDSNTLGIVPAWDIDGHDIVYEDDVIIPPGQTLTFTFEHVLETEETVTFTAFTYFFDSDGIPEEGADFQVKSMTTRLCTDAADDAGIHMINDGRINAYDLGAPLAAYCKSNGIQVWDINDEGHGTLAFTASAEQISAGLEVAVASGQRQLIAEGMGDSLYALPTNELVLVGPDLHEAGKMYTFLVPADRCA